MMTALLPRWSINLPVTESSSAQDLHYSSTDTVRVAGGRQIWVVQACTLMRNDVLTTEVSLPFGRSALIAADPS